MAYSLKSLKQILDIFEGNTPLGATEISDKIGKSTVIVHKYLKELVLQGKLKKIGQGPKVKYVIRDVIENHIGPQPTNFITEKFSFKEKKILDEIFLKFTPDGKILTGLDGIIKWCQERNLNVEEKVKTYMDIYNHIVQNQDVHGLLLANHAFGKDFQSVYLDNVFYADQYKRMDFGRGKLAEMTFYAKISQNKKLIDESIREVIYKLESLVQKEKYDAIAITPWSIERKNQLLKILQGTLAGLGIPFIKIIKYYPNGIPIAQKTLKTREQRILNAQKTIFIDDKNIKKYKKVLLIDDFVGSGATLNETAKKLKDEGVEYVDGFAFVGNLNLSYEIINEI